ncbi:hypothetical protein [Nostoc piscinale]|nr:hypothetical protein [Nostoc piscinale]
MIQFYYIHYGVKQREFHSGSQFTVVNAKVCGGILREIVEELRITVLDSL